MREFKLGPPPEMNVFQQTIVKDKYLHAGENWSDLSIRVSKNVFKAVGLTLRHADTRAVAELINTLKFIPGGRYLYAAGRPYHQTQNCLLLRAQDSREGWATQLHNAAMALMSGAGIGSNYSDIREEGAKIRRTGGRATGPIALMQMQNECGRGIMQGGSRRSAIWAGLKWNHADVFKFIRAKDWYPAEVRRMKEKDYSFPAMLDQTNISVGLDDPFFEAIRNESSHAISVFNEALRRALKTGEPGFSVDCGLNAFEDLRNACTEVTSADTDDICNLGSVNMGAIDSLDEFKAVVALGTKFLLAGTLYSDVPYPEVDRVRTKNRRLGLGLMGVHEWLLKRGLRYEPNQTLAEWLEAYATVSRETSDSYADELEVSRPVKVRAIAPTGTIGIAAGTTTGIEPIFCVAYKRRYLKSGSMWVYQNVVDSVARRLVKSGIEPETIEDAYSLANDVCRRLAFQAYVQKYVDHAISSTINLPAWGSKLNNEDTIQQFHDYLLHYLPQLRGVTFYPDGARGGQPLTPISYQEAIRTEGREFTEEVVDVCAITGKGTCGE